MIKVRMPEDFGGANVQGAIVEPTDDGVVTVDNNVGAALCESFGGVRVPVPVSAPRTRTPLVVTEDTGGAGQS